MLKTIYMELVLNFYKIYNEWPNPYDNKVILKLINSSKERIDTIPSFYKNIFKKFYFYRNDITQSQIDKNVSLLIEFFEKFNKWPTENEVYKGVNLGEFSYNIKFCDLSIQLKDRFILNKLQFFYGVINHKKILTLLKYFYQNNNWPEKEVIFEDINITNLSTKIKKNKISIASEDKSLLEKIGFFKVNPPNHSKVLLLIEFKEKFNRAPYFSEIYKGVNVYNLLYDIKTGCLNISNQDKETLENLDLFKSNTYHKYIALLEFYDIYNRWPNTNETFKTFNIGYFAKNIKFGNTYIPQKQKKILESKGFTFKY